MEQRKIITIGEPRVDILPKETADFFYKTLLARVTELATKESEQRKTPIA